MSEIKLAPVTAEAPLPRFVEIVRVSTQGQADKNTPEIQHQDLDRLRESRPGIPVERIGTTFLSQARTRGGDQILEIRLAGAPDLDPWRRVDEGGLVGLAPREPGPQIEVFGDEPDTLVSAGWTCRDAARVRPGHDVGDGERHADEYSAAVERDPEQYALASSPID